MSTGADQPCVVQHGLDIGGTVVVETCKFYVLVADFGYLFKGAPHILGGEIADAE